jgi:hypothetical protein
MPNGCKATYLQIVCADHPEKTEPRRVRHTISGDQIEYLGSTSTKTADLPAVKTLFNSVISTPDGRFMTINLIDFFLGTPLDNHFEYIRIPVHESLLKSCPYMSSKSLSLTTLCMPKSNEACMASRKQPLLPTNNCKNDLCCMAITPSQLLQAYGNMTLAIFLLLLLSMTLESNM